jgi:ParB-like chromosome segregation protein Spo0J
VRDHNAGKTYWVSPDELDLRLKYLRTPHHGTIEAMAASLTKRGQLSPVSASPNGGCLILIDGFKREAAARAIGLTKLIVMTVNADSVYTKALMYLMNQAKGFSMIQEAILIRELVEVDGLKQVEVASMLEHHKSWVNRRLEMIRRLAPEIVDDLRLNLVPPGCAASLARLPHHNQADFSATIQTHRLQSQQVKRLVDLWCKAKDPDQRKFLLHFPRQALNVVKEASNAHPNQEMIKWSKAFHTILHIAAKLYTDFDQDGRQLSKDTAQHLFALLEQTEKMCRISFDTVRKKLEEPS